MYIYFFLNQQFCYYNNFDLSIRKDVRKTNSMDC